MYLPKSLSEYTGKKYYELENYYLTDGNSNTLKVQEQIFLDTKNTDGFNNIFETTWFYEDTKYQVYDDNKTVNLIVHGF